MNWNTWWLFTVTSLVLDLTPGPAVLYVLSSALRAGARLSVFSAAGILSANALYFALSSLGVGALVLASANLFTWIRWLGAAYLLYMGLRAITGHRAILPKPGAASGDVRPRKLWSGGLFLQLSNPKAIVYFAAILPQFVNPHAPVAKQIWTLGITATLCEFFVLSGYGIVAGRAAEWARQPRYATWTNRIAGLMLIAAAAGIASLGSH